MCKKMNLDRDLAHFTQTNSKWITDLNTKCKTTKLLQGNTAESLDNHGCGGASLLYVQQQRHNPWNK